MCERVNAREISVLSFKKTNVCVCEREREGEGEGEGEREREGGRERGRRREGGGERERERDDEHTSHMSKLIMGCKRRYNQTKVDTFKA